MVFEVFQRLTPLLAHCTECGLTHHHKQKSFILWKSFWPKGASQCSVHYLDLSTFKVWCEWLTDSMTNRRKSLSCYSQLKIILLSFYQQGEVPLIVFLVIQISGYCSLLPAVKINLIAKYNKQEGHFYVALLGYNPRTILVTGYRKDIT